MECLQVGGEYRVTEAESKAEGHKPPPLPPIMTAFNANTPDEYLIAVLRKIKARLTFYNYL